MQTAVKFKIVAEMRINAYCQVWFRYEATSPREFKFYAPRNAIVPVF
jgi:hypothetical protein